MTLDKKERIIIPDPDSGEELLYEVLFTIDEVTETGYSYVAVIPVEQKDDEEVDVIPYRYKESGEDDLSLYPLETDEEWDMVEEVLNTLTEEEID